MLHFSKYLLFRIFDDKKIIQKIKKKIQTKKVLHHAKQTLIDFQFRTVIIISF